jgi:hypothetical protein
MPESSDQMPSEDEDFDITSTDTDYASSEEATKSEEDGTVTEPENSEKTPAIGDEKTEAETEVEPDEQPEQETNPEVETEEVALAEDESASEPRTESEPPEPTHEEVSSSSNQPIVVSDIKPNTIAAAHSVHQTSEFKPSLALPASSISSQPTATQKTKLFSWHYVIELVLLIVVVVLSLTAWSLNSDKHDLSKEVASLNSNPQAIVQKQTQSLISAVGKLMQLPKGETPTVASVTDVAAAKKQSSFFNNAQNGDRVLLYVKSGEAILYRPSTNKIILVAPLTFTTSSNS